MKSFYVIANQEKKECIKLAQEIEKYLKEKGAECLVRGKNKLTHTPMEHTDAIIVLGGDGTLLRAARELAGRKIPFLGINLGHLGYLAEIEAQNVQTALDSLLEDHCVTEERMMLTGDVWIGGRCVGHDMALNDIVLNRSGNLRVVDYMVYVGGQYLNRFTADGIMVATPTGSTGYSLSAGGPIISPTASLLLLTPICPHTLNSRSIVFSGEDTIRIQIGEGRRAGKDETYVTFDGDTSFRMHSGDYVEIKKSMEITRILKINQISFLEVLRNKLSKK